MHRTFPTEPFIFVLGDEVGVDCVCYGYWDGIVGEVAVDLDGRDIDSRSIEVAVDFDGWDFDVLAGRAGVWDGDISFGEVSTIAEVSAKISPSTIISSTASAASLEQPIIT